MYSQTPAYRFI